VCEVGRLGAAFRLKTAVEIFGPADFREQPWKNGGGTTRELLRAPHPHDPEKFAWRVSCATIATSGPFSVFPGIDRTLMLLAGDGFALHCGRAPEIALTECGQMVHFSGDLATHCRLFDGPSRDFNLMVDRALFRGAVALLRLGKDPQPWTSVPLCLVFVLEGTVTLAGPGLDRPVRLAAGELGRVHPAKDCRLESTNALMVKVDLFALT
jgi:uncharacterized protein